MSAAPLIIRRPRARSSAGIRRSRTASCSKAHYYCPAIRTPGRRLRGALQPCPLSREPRHPYPRLTSTSDALRPSSSNAKGSSARQSQAVACSINCMPLTDDPEPPFRKPAICLKSSDDGQSKFAFVEMHKKVARRTAGDFLRRLIAAVPYKVHTVLTDNGTHFTTPGNTSSAAPDIKAALEAGELVWAHKCFLAGSELFSSRPWVTARRRAGREAQALPRSFPSSSHLGCGARAHPLGTTRILTGERSAHMPSPGLLDPSALLIAMALDIVRVGHAPWPRAATCIPPSAPDRAASSRVTPAGPTAFAFAQQMPDEHRELTGVSRQRRHADRGGRGPRSKNAHATDPALAPPPKPLDEHAARMPTALLR